MNKHRQYIISPLRVSADEPESSSDFNKKVCIVQKASKNDIDTYKRYKPQKRDGFFYRSIDPKALQYWIDIVHGYIMSTKETESKYFPVFNQED